MIGRNHVRHRDVGSAPPCISIVVAVAATIMLAMTTMHTSSVDAFHLSPISVPVHQQQRQQFGKVSPTGSVRRRSCALNSRNVEDARAMTEVNNTKTTSTKTAIASMLTAAMFFAGTLGLAAGGAHAVSGGGSDYAGTDISNQDFSNNKYSTKDFTQVIGRNTNFRNSKLVGCRFQNGYLIDADFDSADLTGVSFERTNMENVNLKNAVAIGGYFDQNLLEAKSVENVDFTDAIIPPKILPALCDRPDTKGTNPTTGVETRDSLMCP